MTKDQTVAHRTVALEILSKRVARAVCKFLEVSSSEFACECNVGLTSKQHAAARSCESPRWRVGARGGITSNDIVLIGLIHVSPGSWQPILELTRYIV